MHADADALAKSQPVVYIKHMMTISDSAAARINALTAEGEFKGQMLRLTVNPGGCAGFEYAFSFDTKTGADDKTFSHAGATLVVDSASYDLLQGSVLNYIDNLMGAMFVVENPQAQSGCGCGNSFSV